MGYKSVFDWREDSASRVFKSGPVIRQPGTSQPTALRVAQYDKAGNKIATFTSMSAASVATGVDYRSVFRVTKGQRKTAGGFVFREANE